MKYRELLKSKNRIVVKIGSSSLTHAETGMLNHVKLDRLVRELANLRNMGKDVILVSSGAIAVGRKTMGIKRRPETMAEKQACAAIGQGRLMMIYEKIFAEYNQITAQILMTKNTISDNLNRMNAHNTITKLLEMGVIPIVNENDTVSTYEVEFGDNDTLSAIVAALVEADLLILLSDIDGLFTDDPNTNKEAKFIDLVEELDEKLLEMGKESTGSSVGTGGMATKLTAARIATAAGADMVIANGEDVSVLHRIVEGMEENTGTLFLANKKEDFFLIDYVERL
ncbi:MAG: glutamate 5-kinase [Lachnospiraceae bacterium]|nr:glutamate 5-kinase [Lachnospiraceae bacterium]